MSKESQDGVMLSCASLLFSGALDGQTVLAIPRLICRWAARSAAVGCDGETEPVGHSALPQGGVELMTGIPAINLKTGSQPRRLSAHRHTPKA